MMKFFRKYTKHLLAVFMALLLVVWLAGDALTSMMRAGVDRGGDRVGQVYGQTVHVKDLRPAQMNLEILESLGIRWQMPWAYILMDAGLIEHPYLVGQIRIEPLTIQEWYMLELEAQRRGVRPSQEGFDRLKSQIPPQAIDAVRQRHKVSLAQIDHALRGFLQVTEAAATAAHGIKISEADIQHLIRQTRERARAEFVLLNASAFIDPTYQPTDEELQAHFEEYKNVPPGQGGLDFGYQLPQAVEIEYIHIDPAALKARQRVTDEEAYAYWSANKQEFIRPATQPADETQPPPDPVPYETFSEAKHLVRQKLQMDRARVDALRIAREAISQTNQVWSQVAEQQPEQGEPAAPAANVELYTVLVDRLNERYGGATYGRSDMLTQTDLSTQVTAGQATAMAGTPQQITLAEAAFLVTGLTEAGGPQDRFQREPYQTAPEPFMDRDGGAYIFRTIAVQPARPPESVELVRDQVVEDIRKQRGYEEAGRQARQLAETAAEAGLEQALADRPELAEKLGAEPIQKPAPFARMQMFSIGGMPQFYPASIPGIGSDPALTELVFSRGEKAATQPAAALDVHEQRQQQRWLVVRYVEAVPVVQQEYEQDRNGAMGVLRMQAQLELLGDWFDAEQLRSRVGWQEAPRPQEEDLDELI